ncbi:hypothetical protein JCM8547_000032 [Rhodosporidiobolus lusitaniae]
MLDSLPIELIEHVVRLTVSSFLPHLYYDRLATLTSLCLVLSKLRTVVQPVLFEVVQFKSCEGVESFLEVVEANKVAGKRVRRARFEGQRYGDAPSIDDNLLDVVALPALRALHVELTQSGTLPSVPPSLFSRLEHFSCDWSDIEGDANAVALVIAPQSRNMADNVDLDGGPSYQSLTAAATLHLNKYSCSSRREATDEPDLRADMLNGLRGVAHWLAHGSLKLSSLYLPSNSTLPPLSLS